MRPRAILASAFLAGLIFGLGLMVSGMVSPAKIQGFLDVTGAWDPSLALVMAGAVAVAAIAFAIAGKRASALLGTPMSLPQASAIDRRLVLGAVAFGIGWGLAGFCPGPALVALGAGKLKALVFVGAMLAGMLAFEFMERAREPLRSSEATSHGS
jgi:uncharacterized membrane protein YedE/YeeE